MITLQIVAWILGTWFVLCVAFVLFLHYRGMR